MTTTDRPRLSTHGTTLVLVGLGVIAGGIVAPFGPQLTGICIVAGGIALLVGLVGGFLLGDRGATGER